jgi:hypothetical protein
MRHLISIRLTRLPKFSGKGRPSGISYLLSIDRIAHPLAWLLNSGLYRPSIISQLEFASHHGQDSEFIVQVALL